MIFVSVNQLLKKITLSNATEPHAIIRLRKLWTMSCSPLTAVGGVTFNPGKINDDNNEIYRSEFPPAMDSSDVLESGGSDFGLLMLDCH